MLWSHWALIFIRRSASLFLSFLFVSSGFLIVFFLCFQLIEKLMEELTYLTHPEHWFKANSLSSFLFFSSLHWLFKSFHFVLSLGFTWEIETWSGCQRLSFPSFLFFFYSLSIEIPSFTSDLFSHSLPSKVKIIIVEMIVDEMMSMCFDSKGLFHFSFPSFSLLSIFLRNSAFCFCEVTGDYNKQFDLLGNTKHMELHKQLCKRLC